MTGKLATAILLLGLALPVGAVLAKDAGTLIELSVAADGSCRAKIGPETLTVTQTELDAKLPTLLPDKKAPLRFGASYEKVPYRCFGPIISTLQRLGYDSIALETEPAPLGPEIITPDNPAQMKQPNVLIAFAVACLGIAVFSSMDAVVKGLSLAIGTYGTLLWRSFAGIAVSGVPWLWSRPVLPSRAAMRLHVERGMVSAAMAVLFFWGLARTPMAQAVALTFIAPLIAQGLAVVLLEERMKRGALLGSLLAFGGVLVILWGQAAAKLGPEALRGALAVLLSAVCYAYNIILMRRQAQVADPYEVAFFQSLTVAICLAFAIPWLGELPPAAHVPMIVLAAVLATISLALLSWAYARAEASYLAPVEFTAFIWASLWGWVAFREHVGPMTLLGAMLIVGGCWLAARAPDLERDVIP